MKNLFYLISIFLCVNTSTKAANSFITPDSLFRCGDYANAVLEYERIIFLAESDSVQNAARIKKAICYRTMHDYESAYTETTKFNMAQAGSFQENMFYESAICAYLSEHYNEALIWIKQIKLLPNFSKQKEIILIEALSNSQLTQWNDAKSAAVTYINILYQNNKKEEKITEINILFTKQLPRLKSQKKLEYLMLIPGLGQAYVGYPTEGFLNFGMNLGFLAFGVYQCYYGFYITGYFTGALGINKVYFGGQGHSHFLLDKHNYKELQRFNDALKNTLLN